MAQKRTFNTRDNYNITPYKDTRNQWRLGSLFYETFRDQALDTEVYLPLYSLAEEDLHLDESNRFYGLIDPEWYSHLPEELRPAENVIPSLRAMYLKIEDPKEHLFAKTVFNSWYQWKALLKTSWFPEYAAEWREALDAQIQGAAVQVINQIAQGPDAKLALAAAKWIAEQGYKPKATKGRPTAQQVRNNLRDESKIQTLYDDDAERIGLTSSSNKLN